VGLQLPDYLVIVVSTSILEELEARSIYIVIGMIYEIPLTFSASFVVKTFPIEPSWFTTFPHMTSAAWNPQFP